MISANPLLYFTLILLHSIPPSLCDCTDCCTLNECSSSYHYQLGYCCNATASPTATPSYFCCPPNSICKPSNHSAYICVHPLDQPSPVTSRTITHHSQHDFFLYLIPLLIGLLICCVPAITACALQYRQLRQEEKTRQAMRLRLYPHIVLPPPLPPTNTVAAIPIASGAGISSGSSGGAAALVTRSRSELELLERERHIRRLQSGTEEQK